jgi:hypothetical protein
MVMKPASGGSYRELRIQLRMQKKGSEWGQLQLLETEGWEDFRLPVSRDEGERALEAASRASQSYALRKGAVDRLDPMRSIGERLFATLFEGRREGFYWHMQQEANADLQGLRLRLEFDQADLAAIPWEFLHDGRDYLALSVGSPVVRSTGLAPDPFPPTSRPGMRMLLAAARDGIDDPFGETCPVQFLIEAFKRLQSRFRDLFDFRVIWDPTPERLLKEITGSDFEMLHLVGHAIEGPPGQSALLLSSKGSRTVLDGRQMAALLRKQANIRAVYLNACRSDDLALQLAESVPALLSLRRPMSEHAEVSFVEALYAGILAGQPLEAALTQARQEIGISQPGSREWGLPVLYLQAADGRLFAPPRREETTQAAPDPNFHEKEPPSTESRERRKLQALLTLRRTNLQALEGQALAYNIVPLTIQQEIDAQREEIARLELELRSTP